MNITIDDTSGIIVYSANQWKVQPPSDPIAPEYFHSTYHVTQEPNANITFQFSGTAAYIYGSMGPGHANFSVRWSNRIEPLSAWAPTFRPQQLLWSRVFPADGSEGASPHAIALLVQPNGTNNWIDLDYITLTTDGTTANDTATYPTTNADVLSSIATQTILHDQPGPSSSSNSTGSTTSQSGSKVNGTLIATIILAALLVILVASFFIIRYFRKESRKREDRERNFRYRPTTQTPTLDISPHTQTRTFSPYSQSQSQSRSHATTPIMPPLSAVGSDNHPLIRGGGGVGDQYSQTRSNEGLLRDAATNNGSVVGWSTAGSIIDIARVGSPESGSRGAPSTMTDNNVSITTYATTIPRPPSAKPPSYTAGHHYPQTQYWPSQPFEHISEVDSTESTTYPPNSPPPLPQTDPLRLHTHRSSIAKRPFPNVTTPRKPPPTRPSRDDVVLYDDGDSRRTNFLQV